MDGQALLELYDTPGLEDAIALLDYLERQGFASAELLAKVVDQKALDADVTEQDAELLLAYATQLRALGAQEEAEDEGAPAGGAELLQLPEKPEPE